ncbi:hypothetical protein JF66_05745 [Cryobacterium sp. MLB-32]|uniref:HAD domain-containing protein n=1 Tax=Cryobacterium sp. MLB-32 TaxID=1529318 RepID=UPI0004E73B21|nr:HAD domain-containing protein [Cryobacterium sp. MLB-32]KFF60250.1 hypothetical protein JF66_05745 [Cryobacterium sp. MLB-32]
MTKRTILILLDVDGVLNPRLDNQRLALDPARENLVRGLAELGSVVWATTWSPTHTFHLTKDLGLPAETEGIAFPRDMHVDVRSPAPTPKLHWVGRWLARQDAPPTAVVWIDDLLRHDAVDWAAAQPYPTLLVHPQASVGLTADHLADVRLFVDGLAPVTR